MPDRPPLQRISSLLRFVEPVIAVTLLCGLISILVRGAIGASDPADALAGWITVAVFAGIAIFALRWELRRFRE